jgi:hypothetical protein
MDQLSVQERDVVLRGDPRIWQKLEPLHLPWVKHQRHFSLHRVDLRIRLQRSREASQCQPNSDRQRSDRWQHRAGKPNNTVHTINFALTPFARSQWMPCSRPIRVILARRRRWRRWSTRWVASISVRMSRPLDVARGRGSMRSRVSK